jgi:hypothetical protein
MKIHSLVLGTLFLFMLAGNVNAASFYCAKAVSEIEKLICGNLLLPKNDDEAAASYFETVKRAAEQVPVKTQQSERLCKGRDVGTNVACAGDAYTGPKSQCRSVVKAKSSGKPKSGQSDRDACQIVADHVNRGMLEQLVVPPQDPTPDKKELERIFDVDDEESSPYGVVGYWRIDLDNDGILDHLMIEAVERVNWGLALAVSGKKGGSLQVLSDDKYLDLDVLKVNGRYYILSGYNDRLGRLWRLNNYGEFVRVCSFEPRSEPDIELVAGEEQAVCSEARVGRVHHVKYALSHALGTSSTRDDDPIDGLAQVDIDNDGTLDNVVRIDFLLHGGRSCQGRYIAVTDDTRTKIPDTKLNKLLSKEAVCDWGMDVFVHEGVTYVDAQDDTGNRKIYLIKGDKVDMICEFRGRLVYDVVDVAEESKK